MAVLHNHYVDFLEIDIDSFFLFLSNGFCLSIYHKGLVNIRSTPSFFHAKAHQGEVKQIGPHRQTDL